MIIVGGNLVRLKEANTDYPVVGNVKLGITYDWDDKTGTYIRNTVGIGTVKGSSTTGTVIGE